MLKLGLLKAKDRHLKVLCLGAHSDDIEIGCGGTILKFAEKYKNMVFRWVVFSSDAERAAEAQKSAQKFLKGAKEKTISTEGFRDGFFPYVGADIKEYFEVMKSEFSPDVIFTHYRNDLHQDHRVISELTWNTYRDHLIVEYEIPKYDGDLGSPNVFVHLDEDICRQKIRHVLDTFRTQTYNQWFTEETFKSIMKLRGIESNSSTGYAEAFYSRKLVLG